VDEHKRLLEDGREISVALKERDAQGRKSATKFQFGIGGGVAWVWYQEDKGGSDSRYVLEEVLIYEAAEKFGGYLERMQLRRCLANPSPLSAELVEIDPSIKDMVEHLEVEFGIKLGTK
jgi:hypothetical protein